MRSSAIVASEASVCISARSSEENARKSSVVATEITAITRSSLTSGTNAALFAPVSVTSRELTRVEPVGVVDGEARRFEGGARDAGGLPREVDANVRPPQHVLAVRAGEEARGLASILRHEGECDETDGEERRDLVEEGADDTFDVGLRASSAGDPLQALELPFALRRRRPGGARPRPRSRSPTARPSASAATTTATLSQASARPLMPTGSESIELMLGAAIVRSKRRLSSGFSG